MKSNFVRVKTLDSWVTFNMNFVSEISEFGVGHLRIRMCNRHSYLVMSRNSKPIKQYLAK